MIIISCIYSRNDGEKNNTAGSILYRVLYCESQHNKYYLETLLILPPRHPQLPIPKQEQKREQNANPIPHKIRLPVLSNIHTHHTSTTSIPIPIPISTTTKHPPPPSRPRRYPHPLHKPRNLARASRNNSPHNQSAKPTPPRHPRLSLGRRYKLRFAHGRARHGRGVREDDKTPR